MQVGTTQAPPTRARGTKADPMDAIVLESDRELRVNAAEARMAVIRALRSQEFTLTTEQVSMVTAKRGSQIAGSVQPKKLPVTVKVTFQPTRTGCSVSVRIADAWRSPVAGKVWGMNAPYRAVLDDIQMAIDEALAPHSRPDAEFAEGTVTTATRDVAGLSAGNGLLGRAGGAAADRVDALLTPSTQRVVPKRLNEVVLRSSKGAASFGRAEAEALFTVGLLVSSKPGSMPANLAKDVELFAAKLETAVAAQPQGRLAIDVEDSEIPVAEFLGQQATIREALPLRTLHVCTTCKFEKVVNPDYEKLQEKNHRKRVLTGAVGATVSTSGISPFLLVGSLLKLKNFDIPFVCPRCQGLDADSSVITYCPNCGQRRDEAVLRTCGRCKYNFPAHHHDDDPFWHEEEPEPLVAAAPAFVAPPPVASAPAPAPPPVAPAPAPPPQLTVPAGPVAPPPPTGVTSSDLPRPVIAGPPGWLVDPTHRHQLRYWDGLRWSDHTSDNGVASIDPP